MKRLEAIIAAALVTGVVALCRLSIGLNALLNPSTVRASDAPGTGLNAAPNSVASSSNLNNSADQAQIAELQNEISQYQQQLDQANAQLQQYQQVLIQLQQSGVIRIGRDGTILLRAPRGDGD